MEYKTLNIIRGLPGSGKSTYAKSILDARLNNNSHRNTPSVHIETDMFFGMEGVYDWDPDKLSRAHRWCLNSAKIFLSCGVDVIVSNTFTTIKEMDDYVRYAITHGHDVIVDTMTNEYGSVHDVPDSTIERMRARFVSHEETLKWIRDMQEELTLGKIIDIDGEKFIATEEDEFDGCKGCAFDFGYPFASEQANKCYSAPACEGVIWMKVEE